MVHPPGHVKETYPGTKNIKLDPTNFNNTPTIRKGYAAEKTAPNPNNNATNLCANSCKIIPGATASADVHNASKDPLLADGSISEKMYESMNVITITSTNS